VDQVPRISRAYLDRVRRQMGESWYRQEFCCSFEALEGLVYPDFARCVDIHRKPGYDPVELFLDPKLAFPRLKIAWRLLQKQLGFRMLMDVIPLDASLVKGSHGIRPADPRHYPVLISPRRDLLPEKPLAATEVYRVIQEHIRSR